MFPFRNTEYDLRLTISGRLKSKILKVKLKERESSDIGVII